MAQLSQQLRRFLDDKAWLENRRIMDILHGIETKALALRESPPPGDVMHLEDTGPTSRCRWSARCTSRRCGRSSRTWSWKAGDDDVDASVLFSPVVVDKARLVRHVRRTLRDRSQVTLHELCESEPLQQGLAELVAYLELDDETFRTQVDEQSTDTVSWRGTAADGAPAVRHARMPRVIFVR